MIQAGEVNYIPNVIVDRITPQGDGIQIGGRCPRTNAPRVFNAGTVFVAVGVLESTRIVLNSTNGFPASLQVRQSDIFTIPMLRYRAAPGSVSTLRVRDIAAEVVSQCVATHWRWRRIPPAVCRDSLPCTWSIRAFFPQSWPDRWRSP